MEKWGMSDWRKLTKVRETFEISLSKTTFGEWRISEYSIYKEIINKVKFVIIFSDVNFLVYLLIFIIV